MAIKGKRRPKSRSGRVVAGAPRQFIVPPKTPLFQRTGARVILVILVEVLVFGAVVMAGARSEEQAYRNQISRFTSLVHAALYGSGAAQQLPTAPLVLPELGQTMSQLQAGEEIRERDVVENAESWGNVAERAANTIEEIEVQGLALIEAQNMMAQGLRVYSGVADLLGVAIQLEADPQTTLLGAMNTEYQAAAEIFDAGYGKLLEESRKAGLPFSSTPSFPQDPGVLP
ncbi:MAG: hypothetical protein ACRDH8_12710 [Actinomycetota bacterium]